jgi:prefoldin subunit 5
MKLEAKDKQIYELKKEINNKNDIISTLTSKVEEIKQSQLN